MTVHGSRFRHVLATGRGFAVAAAFVLVGAPLPAQDAPPPPDTFRDSEARTLILRAREARAREIEGIQSYEGVLRERIYVGLTALRFRRERSLFERERVARLRWSANGERAIQWIGARQAIPIVGADTRRREVAPEAEVGRAGEGFRDELRRDLPEEMLRDTYLPSFAFDPAGDRLAFGSDWALHPLADSAAAHYRFSTGDTLRIHLPPDGDLELVEIRVEPRRADFHLVAGSLWFDAETGSLVRATYRPARAFNLLLDEPEDAEDVPGFLQPVEADISYITVEYSLHELRFWLPRRFALEGEARLGRLIQIPLTVEWRVGEYEVNEPTSSIPAVGPLPPGWSRRETRVEDDDGTVSYVTVIVPEADSLLDSPELSEDFGRRAPAAFTDQEIAELKGELQALLPTYRRLRPQLAWGLTRGLTRYNRVEGLSTGVLAEVPLAPATTLEAEARIGTGDREPYGTLALRHGPEDRLWTLQGYHRLDAMGDWSTPFSFSSSVGNLVVGSSESQIFRATGVSLSHARRGSRVRWQLEGFLEDEAPATRTTDFHLLGLFGDDTVATVVPAEPALLYGARGELRWFAGVDPNALILTGQFIGEVAVGDAAYRRVAATLSASHPLPRDLAGALEFGAGTLLGDELTQRDFYIGGSGTLRGFGETAATGTSFWRARGELASGFAGARVGLFTDAGWAGPRQEFSLEDPLVAVGVGTSLLDGLVRFDVARAVRRGSGWKVHLYVDGLF